jgi:hypothetical protein
MGDAAKGARQIMSRMVLVAKGIVGEQGEFVTALACELMGSRSVIERKRGMDVVLVEVDDVDMYNEDPRVAACADVDDAAIARVLARAAGSAAAQAEYDRLFNKKQSATDRAMSAYLNGDERALGMGANHH